MDVVFALCILHLAGARSAPLRGLVVFYSSAVAINQSKRLRAKGHLAEGSFRGGSSAAGGEGVPFSNAKLLFFKMRTTPISGTNEQAREFNATIFCGRGLL